MPRSLWCRSIRKPGWKDRGRACSALLVQHLAAGQPAAEDLQRGVGVDAVGLQEDDRLGEQLDVAGDDQLVGGLDGLPGAGGSDVHDGLADGLENRRRRPKSSAVPPTMIDSAAFMAPASPPETGASSIRKPRACGLRRPVRR